MASTTYDASTIQVLEGLEPVRKRPAMYIGGTGVEGYHHLLWEIVDNSVDEAMNGHATSVSVTLHADGRSATVTDNGRGIPVEMHPTAKRPALEVILCTLHAGGKFEGKAYAASGGLHGVGSSVVNALSEEMVATVKRGGVEYRQSFRRGKPRSQLERVGEARGTGTTIKFRPDPDTFGDLAFESDRVRERLETIAYIHKGLRILFRDEMSGSYEEFRHEGGIRDWALALARKTGRTPIVPEPFYACKENGVRVEVALCWTDGTRELFSSYANGIPTGNGGTHETGAKDAITKAVRNYIDTHSLQPKGIALAAEDIREGVVCVTSVFLAEPQFQGQTKEKLNNPEMRGAVENAVRTTLEQFLNHNRTVADVVVTRVIQAARARLASRSAEDQVRRKSPVNNRLNLPGKLADCSSNDASESELFIVEGDSAGGSAKQGRDRESQAILPLRGKVLNTEQASLKKLMENEELSNIVSALGCGIGKDFNRDRLRYHRVILLMDADVDGHHIATLLLTFFYRYLPGLIDGGHLFLAQPPLYRIDVGQQTHWAADDAEKARVLKRLPPRASPEVTRFKGLGEMPPKVLFDTTLDPRKRRLLKVTIPAGEHQSTDQMFADLMGKDAAPRYQAIMESGAEFDELDV
ncbi:MAG: DNA gyrase subunit B [Deltaproteobacteria bacterium]|nr:DNA gyrase subunit B [Deltaproteobacteria bacterium]